jgi:hypothetical protein
MGGRVRRMAIGQSAGWAIGQHIGRKGTTITNEREKV